MKRAPPPPSSAAPSISRESVSSSSLRLKKIGAFPLYLTLFSHMKQVEAAKKKMGAPPGAAPAGLAAVMAKIKSNAAQGGGGSGFASRDDDELEEDDDDELFDEDYGRQYEKPTSRSKPPVNERPQQQNNRQNDDDRRHRYDDDDNEIDEFDDDEDHYNRNDRGYDDRRDRNDRDDRRDVQDNRKRGGGDPRRSRDDDIDDIDDYEEAEAAGMDDERDDDRRRGGGWATSGPSGGKGSSAQSKGPPNDKADAKDSWAKADSRGAKSANAAAASSSSSGREAPGNGATVTTVSTAAAGTKPAVTGKPVSFNFQPILKATYRELRTFVMSPCERGLVTRCYIERSRRGENMFAPVYSLCADLEDGTGRELLVCRKVMKSFTSHYVFSLKSEDLYRPRDQRSRLFLGKLRATNNNEFVLFDNGATKDAIRGSADFDGNNSDDDGLDDVPGAKKSGSERSRDAKGSKDEREMNLFRKELAVVFYNTKKRPAPLSVRGTEVCIPFVQQASGKDRAEDKSGSAVEVNNLSAPFQKIRGQAKQNELHANKCFIMHERTSRYDPLSSCLVDFKGRANMASVKNFQLVESSAQELQGDGRKAQELDGEKEYILQMGKVIVPYLSFVTLC